MKSAAHGDAVFETEMYSNAGMWRHTFKGGQTTMIYLRGREAAISFISGTEKTDPSAISEDTVHLLPWQINNKWKQLGPPCLLPDGVALTFDYADRYQDKDQPFQFRGEIKRTGARMTYAMSSEHTYDSDGASVTLSGVLDYEKEQDALSLDTDVQGSRVYWKNEYLTTLATGQPVSISAALQQIERQFPQSAATPAK